jgi:hypothetical protein
MSEANLREPFSTAYRVRHNADIIGASDTHAMIWGEGAGGLDGETPISNPDFFWVYQRKINRYHRTQTLVEGRRCAN